MCKVATLYTLNRDICDLCVKLFATQPHIFQVPAASEAESARSSNAQNLPGGASNWGSDL